MNAAYQRIIEQFGLQRILVIGETMLDVYLSGTSDRICREAPVPIVNIQGRRDVPGGAANTAVNLAAMGAKPTFVSLTGDDRPGHTAAELLTEAGVDTRALLFAADRQTIVKHRVVSDGQIMLRYDAGSTDGLPEECERRLVDRLNDLYWHADAVLISDYGYGVVCDRLITALGELLEHDRKLLVVDSKNPQRFRELKPAAVKPNYQETLRMLGIAAEERGARAQHICSMEREILERTGAQVVAVTVDTEGAVILERGKPPYRTYARAVPDSQATGAGDTYVSALTLGLSLGMPPLNAAELAAAAAAVVVRKDGTAVCSAQELADYFAPPRKIVEDRAELANRVRAYREQGRRIVFTNGCFDILHRGHTLFLAQAKALGDVLIVGVNSDNSVRRLKGQERPINPLEDRLQVLAALDCVDHVVSFEEDSPVGLIEAVRPDVYTKGGDYTRESLPEAPVVESLGGVVQILPYEADRSTTSVIQRIRSTTSLQVEAGGQSVKGA